MVFLSAVDEATRSTFRDCEILRWNRVTAELVRKSQANLVLLHNTSADRCDKRLPAITVQYLHSKIRPAQVDHTIYCSQWLAAKYGPENHSRQILHQAVPRAPSIHTAARALRDDIVIGRLCTPISRKWPHLLETFYRQLATAFPRVRWEFVGCPESLKAELRTACGGRARFHPASWSARRWLGDWDALLYHNPDVTESFGRTVAEAMRAGCIPIVDNRGGFREQIIMTPDRTGFLCDTLEDFHIALDTLHDSTTRWQIAHAARSHAECLFSESVFAAGLKRTFRAALRTQMA